MSTRPRLVSLPADATWPAPQRPAHIRPCHIRPANWWDTGDPGNAEAVALCGTCPFEAGCKPQPDENVAGQVRAGVAYDDRSKPADIKNLPHHHHDLIVQLRAQGKSFEQISGVIHVSATSIRAYCKSNGIPTTIPGGKVADHHDTIARLRAAGLGWQKVADRIGRDREAVRAYWYRYQQSQAVEATRQGVAA